MYDFFKSLSDLDWVLLTVFLLILITFILVIGVSVVLLLQNRKKKE